MPYYSPDGSVHYAKIPKWPPVGWTYNTHSQNWEPSDGQDHERIVDIICPDGTIVRYPKESLLRQF